MYRIIAVGKIKEKYLAEGIAEYQKRLQGSVLITEVKEVNTRDISKNIKQEGEAILDEIKADEYVVSLVIKGQVMESTKLATFLHDKELYGTSKITFVIGGSNGLSDEVIKRANMQLSFSAFTFPHQLMRLILIEQIYRSVMINNHKEYHK